MALAFRQCFLLNTGETVKGATLWTKYVRERVHPEFPGSSLRCNLDMVETIITTDKRFTPKIFWSDAIFGPNGNPLLLQEYSDGGPSDIAIIKVVEGGLHVVRGWDVSKID